MLMFIYRGSFVLCFSIQELSAERDDSHIIHERQKAELVEEIERQKCYLQVLCVQFSVV